MEKFIYRSDLALEMKEQIEDDFNEVYESYQDSSITVEKINLDSDYNEFNKKKGFYLSLRFEDIEIEHNREEIIDVLTRELMKLFDGYDLTSGSKVLVVGLGNELLSCDALGPFLQDGLLVTNHIDEGILRQESLKRVALLIPRVKGQTGLETAEVVMGVTDLFKPELVIVVDALATKSMRRVHRVIQISDTGIHPGSGVGNYTKEINSETLKCPVLAIGVPTVVDVASISYDVIELMERYFADNIANPSSKLKVGKREQYQGELDQNQKELLFGEIGKLNDDEKRILLNEIIEPVGLNMIVTSKSVDEEVKQLSKIISHSLNQALHYQGT